MGAIEVQGNNKAQAYIWGLLKYEAIIGHKLKVGELFTKDNIAEVLAFTKKWLCGGNLNRQHRTS